MCIYALSLYEGSQYSCEYSDLVTGWTTGIHFPSGQGNSWTRCPDWGPPSLKSSGYRRKVFSHLHKTAGAWKWPPAFI